MSDASRFLPPALENVAAAILVAAGATEGEAATVARYLVKSDLVGHASHGVLRVKQYVEQIQKGQIVCRTEPYVVNDGPGFAVLEGGLGFGQIGAEQATRLACKKARTQGIALVALRNSAHVGRLGDWVELAAELGCVSFHFVNTLAMPRVAPWGGREGRLSTNPLAWGMPVAGGEPIVVDLTTSVVAEGKVRLHRDAGTPLPPGWIVDRDGQSSTDANALYEGGSLLPLGGLDAGHKGYALSLMVDLMAGAISGGGASGANRTINCNNFTVIAIDASQLAPGDAISTEAARFSEWIKSATPTDATRPVLLPGEVERAARDRHLREGLALGSSAIQTLKDAAKLAGAPATLIEQFISSATSRNFTTGEWPTAKYQSTTKKMKPRVLQKGPYMPALETALAQEFDVHQLWREANQQSFLAQHGSEFVGLATSARWGTDATLIDALPNLKVISSFGVGIDTIDIAAANRRGIAVSNTPDVLNDCVADIAFGLLIDVSRGLSASDRFVRRGDWAHGAFALQTRVSGKRLGILGLGRIGRAIARRASGFDMEVRYHNRRRVDDVGFGYMTSPSELARWADFLVVASSGGPETKHLVSAEVIKALGPKGFLINISRGSVVDEKALVDALVNRKIAGAALDVFENEPQVPAELLTLDNVVLLPHIASGTNETRQAMADLTLANLRSFFSEGRLLTPVS